MKWWKTFQQKAAIAYTGENKPNSSLESTFPISIVPGSFPLQGIHLPLSTSVKSTSRHRRANAVQFHFCEVPTIFILRETENRMVVVRPKGRGKGGVGVYWLQSLNLSQWKSSAGGGGDDRTTRWTHLMPLNYMCCVHTLSGQDGKFYVIYVLPQFKKRWPTLTWKSYMSRMLPYECYLSLISRIRPSSQTSYKKLF